MGNCLRGSPDNSATGSASTAIDDELKRQANQAQLNLKILILGAGESGKSTVVKQLRNIHKGKADFTRDETESFKAVLHTNTIQAMNHLIRAIDTLEISWGDDPDIKAAADSILEHDENVALTLDDAVRIEKLWGAEPIQAAFKRRGEFYFPDAGPYYFQKVFTFIEDSYSPTEEDVVMARVRTTGMFMTEFEQPPITWKVVDVGGQRSERKKWIKFFDDVQGILFVVNLAGYNKVLFEDQSKNRMTEALELFEKITRTRVFKDTPIFLFLNKKDLFEQQLRDEGLDVCFPEYEGSNDMQECMEYITKQFQKKMPPNKDITGHHFVAARMKKDVKYAFEEVKQKLQEINKKSINSAVKSLDS